MWLASDSPEPRDRYSPPGRGLVAELVGETRRRHSTFPLAVAAPAMP